MFLMLRIRLLCANKTSYLLTFGYQLLHVHFSKTHMQLLFPVQGRSRSPTSPQIKTPNMISYIAGSVLHSEIGPRLKEVENRTQSLRPSIDPFRIPSSNLSGLKLGHLSTFQLKSHDPCSRFVISHQHCRRQTTDDRQHDNSRTVQCNCNVRLKSELKQKQTHLLAMQLILYEETSLMYNLYNKIG